MLTYDPMSLYMYNNFIYFRDYYMNVSYEIKYMTVSGGLGGNKHQRVLVAMPNVCHVMKKIQFLLIWKYYKTKLPLANKYFP